MTRRPLTYAALLCGLFAVAGARAADVVEDLSKVRGIRAFDGPESAKALLKKNGFVVVRRFYHRVFSPYLEQGDFGRGEGMGSLPPFVTADSLHRTFHVIFEDEIRNVETAFAAEVAEITQEMKVALAAMRDAAPDDADRDAVSLAQKYFHVADLLMAGRRPAPDVPQDVAQEMQLIQASAGVARSPLFGYSIDYSQFKPRSFYTRTPALRRYFRAMTWYGSAAFLIRSDVHTRAAMAIARAFDAAQDARERWKRIDRTYSYLIGPCDDLTPEEYAALIRAMKRRRIAGDPLEWFQKQAAAMRDPRINSMVLPPEQMGQWRTLTKGMRFFGLRYLPDSELFQDVTFPKVPDRLFPSGLDVMAANGSERARRIIQEGDAAGDGAYLAMVDRGKARFDALKQAAAPSHYAQLLKVLQAVTAPPLDDAPAFARTEAYADKSLMTALGAWASMRHAWQLQAKASLFCLAGFGASRIPGYVEPNPAFVQAMRQLAAGTMEGLRGVHGVHVERFQDFDALLAKLESILAKQLKGKRFTNDEAAMLRHYGEVLFRLQGFHLDMYADRSLEWMALVSDVHTEALVEKKCLEVATGGAMPIYAVVETPYGRQLVAGAVYSYYEFLQPLANRLTDEAWRRTCDSGKLPAMPGWCRSFIADYDATDLIARVRKGEQVPELLSVADPKVDAFLEKAVQAGGELDGKKNYWWALSAAARRLPKKMLPLLTRLVQEAPLRLAKTEQGYEYLDGPARQAAWVLADIAGPAQMAVLESMVFGQDRLRAELAVRVCAATRLKEAEHLLLRVISQRPDDRVRVAALHHLEYAASWDAVPDLLARCRAADEQRKEQILRTLTNIWLGHEDGSRPPFPTEAAPDEVAASKRRVADLVLGLAEFSAPVEARTNSDLAEQAWWAAVEMRLPGVVSAIRARAAKGQPLDPSDLDALQEMATPEAVETLLLLSRFRRPTVRAEVGFLLASLAEDPVVRQRLTQLLDDSESVPAELRQRVVEPVFVKGKPQVHTEGTWRVCDMVAAAVSFRREAPPFDARCAEAERDRKIAALKKWLARYPPAHRRLKRLYDFGGFFDEDRDPDAEYIPPADYTPSSTSDYIREQQKRIAEEWRKLIEAERKAEQKASDPEVTPSTTPALP